jgi:hypothetical protein
MDTDRLQLERGFLVRWVLASAIGLLIGFTGYFILVVGFSPEQGFIQKTLVSAVGGGFFGVAVGGMQMFVLRSEVSEMNHWMLVNLVGGTIGGVVALPLAEAAGDAMGFNMAVFAGGIVLGLSLGIAQVVILNNVLNGSGWWVLAHTVGIPLGWVLGRGLGESIHNLILGGLEEGMVQVIANVIVIILFFGGYGLITGGVLTWLLNRKNKSI